MKTKLFITTLFALLLLFACKKDIPDEKIKIVTDTVIVRDTVVMHDTVCIETTKYTWQRLADFPFGAEYLDMFPSFVAQGNIYFLHNTTVYKYDTGNNTWSNINPFPVARDSYAAFSVNNYGFVASGACDKYDCAKTPLLWRYIPDTDTFVPIDTLLTYYFSQPNYVATFGFTTFFIYAESKKSVTYNFVTRNWGLIDNANLQDNPEICFALNNRLYVGLLTNATSSTNNQIWEYNPDTDLWIAKKDFPSVARRLCASFAIGGKGYMFGGAISHTNYLRDMWQYNPVTDQWQQLPDIPSNFPNPIFMKTVVMQNAAYVFCNNQTWKFTVEQSTKKIKQ